MKKTIVTMSALLLAGSLGASMLSDALNNAAKSSAQPSQNAQENLKQNVGDAVPGKNLDQVLNAVRQVLRNRGFREISVEMDGTGYAHRGRVVRTGRLTGSGDLYEQITVHLRRKWSSDGRGDGGTVLVSVDGKHCAYNADSGLGDCTDWANERITFKADVVEYANNYY